MPETLFDVIIVGYGPAGITAGIYAARKKLRVLLIGEVPGGEVLNSGTIENWPGDGETDGASLTAKLMHHLDLHRGEVEIRDQLQVQKINQDTDGLFSVGTTDGATTRGKTVIYATGRHPRLLNVPGEKEFKNLGVTHCATCDAPLFAGKKVAVIGGGNSGAEAVIMLQKISPKIYLLHLEDTLAADAVLVDNFKNDPNVEILYQARTTSITGDITVTSLTYIDALGQENTLDVEGIFVTIGAIPNTAPVKELVRLDTQGAIPADRYGRTDVPGFFAAGDVTDIRDAQIVVAAGHGCSAALSAGDYLSRLPAKL